MELWDAYDAQGSRIGRTLVRGEPIPDGCYHVVCEALVRHADGEYLLMRRHPAKKAYPGYLEATAGGSALCGEDALACMCRELREETGITNATLTLVAHSRDDEENALFFSYLAITDCPKDGILLQQGETVGYVWMNEQQFVSHLHSDAVIPRQRARYEAYLRSIGYM